MYLVFSDLDGTLLDHDTYDYAPAREGLTLLKKHGIPLVLVSSKTQPEMEILHEEMGLEAPYIFENGGGISWPGKGKYPEYLGMNVAALKKKKDILESCVGEPVLFITEMTVDEIVKRTGLSSERALLAQKRMTSLPFLVSSIHVIDQKKMAEINSLMREQGLSITKGGRFYHFLSDGSDKGSAINRVVDYYLKKSDGAVTTIGIGDSENDIAMFKVVDMPVVVRKKNNTVIDTGIEGIRITSGAGPEGFTEAVKQAVIINES